MRSTQRLTKHPEVGRAPKVPTRWVGGQVRPSERATYWRPPL